MKRWSVNSATLLATLLIAATVSVRADDSTNASVDAAQVDYSKQIQPLLTKYCVGCHNPNDKDGGLVLDRYEAMLAGGEHGAIVSPGRSRESRIIGVLTGAAEPSMPPDDNLKPTSEEITLLAAWIDSGAKGPAGELPDPTVLIVPRILPTRAPVDGISALAFSPNGQLVAIGRYGQVELISVADQRAVSRLPGHRGRINAVQFSANGEKLIAAGGEPGLFGEVKIWNVADGSLACTIVGHQDSLYAALLSPDGAVLATGGYDQQIKLWDAASGSELRTLVGHNDCVYELAFRAGGKVLASASGDRTAKLWNVETGERLETFSQPTKELFAVAFRPDGAQLAAGGGDSRIRVWQISQDAKENSNPLLISRVGHEGAIVKLLYSSDGRVIVTAAEDRTIKVWDADTVREIRSLGSQSDSVQALAISPDDKLLAVGRLDGSLALYRLESGELAPPSPPAKPEFASLWPRGAQQGATARIKLRGKHLLGVECRTSHPGLRALPADSSATAEQFDIDLHVAVDAPRGRHELWLTSAAGESARMPVFVDDLPQVVEGERRPTTAAMPLQLPVDVWGTLSARGERDRYSFEAAAGQTITFDIAGRLVAANGDLVLTLFDENGKVLAANNDFDGGADPLLSHTFAQAGRYTIQVTDLRLDGSAEHFYRLAIGSFGVATGIYPLSLPANQPGEVELVGVNLTANAKTLAPATPAGEIELPSPLVGSPRYRHPLKLTIGAGQETTEIEPNDQPASANPISTPMVVNGRIATPGESDLFRFESRRGQAWIVEVEATRRESPLDSVVDVLHADGRPVARSLLQATRDSYLTFRGTDASGREFRLFNWEEMNLNEYLYVGGEVVKLFRAPQGPDSGFLTYDGDGGRRRTEFDTTATSHALDDPAYIVSPLPPDAKITPNGLPVFPLYYSNDDDAERRRGADSRLAFVAPADDSYLIRVRDSRGEGSPRHVYRLIARPAEPDFHITLHGANPTIGRSSGKAFSATVERVDGFDGAVTIEISGALPPGLTVTSPLLIEAGHREAKGVVYAAADVPTLSDQNRPQLMVKARAEVNGRIVTKEVNALGVLSVAEQPKLLVKLMPQSNVDGLAQAEVSSAASGGGSVSATADNGGARANVSSETAPSVDRAANPSDLGSLPEIVVVPGRRVPARLTIERHGFDGLVNLDVLNLPHGVIVDDIGLNAVQILEGQTERQIFLYCAPWVTEMTRDIFALARVEGDQASSPVRLRIRPLQTGR